MKVTGATPMVPAAWPLTGREQELALISAALEDPGVAGVALVGLPGVGKTRLGMQLLELATARGFGTVTVRASRSARTVPYAALAGLFSFVGVTNDAEAPVLATLRAVEKRTAEPLVVFVDDAQQLDAAS